MEHIDSSQLARTKNIYSRPGYVEIYIATHVITGKTYCVKQIPAESNDDVKEKYNEIIILTSLDHNNIVPIRSCFVGGQTSIDSISIVMDYFSEGDLEKFILNYKNEKKEFSEGTILLYSYQLIDALYYMQSKGIAHRDLKPHNIFLDSQGTILKVGDFGSSKTISSLIKKISDQEHTIVGTPLYLSPLIRESFIKSLAGQDCRVKHDLYKSDVYSLGLILLYMASFKNPVGLTDLNTLQGNLNARLAEINQNYPRLRILLEKMLQVNEVNRYDFCQLKELITEIFNKTCGRCNLMFELNELQEILSSKICITCYNQFMAQPAYCQICNQTRCVRDFFILNGVYHCKACLMRINTFSERLVCLSCNKFLFADLGCPCLEERCYICKSAKHEGACNLVLQSMEIETFYPYFQCLTCDNYISNKVTSNSFFTCSEDQVDFCVVCFESSSEDHHRCNVLLENGYLL